MLAYAAVMQNKTYNYMIKISSTYLGKIIISAFPMVFDIVELKGLS